MHRAAVVRIGNRATLALGKDILDKFEWPEGAEGAVQVDEVNRKVIITAGRPGGAWADETGIAQLEDWVNAHVEYEARKR